MLPESDHSSAKNLSQHPLLQTNSGRYLGLGTLLVCGGFIGSLLWAGLAPLDKGIAVMCEQG